MKLSEMRRTKDMGLREAAKALNMPPSTLSAFEFGRDLPDTPQIEALSELYGVTADQIREGLPAPSEVIALSEHAGRMMEAFAASKLDAKAHGLGRGVDGVRR